MRCIHSRSHSSIKKCRIILTLSSATHSALWLKLSLWSLRFQGCHWPAPPRLPSPISWTAITSHYCCSAFCHSFFRVWDYIRAALKSPLGFYVVRQFKSLTLSFFLLNFKSSVNQIHVFRVSVQIIDKHWTGLNKKNNPVACAWDFSRSRGWLMGFHWHVCSDWWLMAAWRPILRRVLRLQLGSEKKSD